MCILTGILGRRAIATSHLNFFIVTTIFKGEQDISQFVTSIFNVLEKEGI